MFTLVLLFALVMLIDEMVTRGENPFGMASEEQTSPTRSTPVEDEPSETKEVTLYFADEEGRALVGESRRVALTDYTTDNCRLLFDELREGPRGSGQPVLPPSAQLRSVYLLKNGDLVVDFTRDLELGAMESASAEGLMVYSIVNTLTQGVVKGVKENAVRRVLFLLEGAPPSETFPSHLDLAHPIAADPYWIASTREAEDDA